jgi:periplasmic divalent cation tolerance protein
MEYIIVFVTASNLEEAKRIAKALVDEKLAACVNILAHTESIFHWKGKVWDAKEALLIAKTKKKNFVKLNKRVLEMHSYEVPEIIALPIIAASEKYIDWIDETLKSPKWKLGKKK